MSAGEVGGAAVDSSAAVAVAVVVVVVVVIVGWILQRRVDSTAARAAIG